VVSFLDSLGDVRAKIFVVSLREALLLHFETNFAIYIFKPIFSKQGGGHLFPSPFPLNLSSFCFCRVEKSVEERLSEHLKITGFPYEEKKEEDEVIGLPEITPEMDQVINTAMASRGEV